MGRTSAHSQTNKRNHVKNCLPAPFIPVIAYSLCPESYSHLHYNSYCSDHVRRPTLPQESPCRLVLPRVAPPVSQRRSILPLINDDMPRVVYPSNQRPSLLWSRVKHMQDMSLTPLCVLLEMTTFPSWRPSLTAVCCMALYKSLHTLYGCWVCSI